MDVSKQVGGTFAAITLGFLSMGLSCGVRIDRTGILVNDAGVSRERIGASPPDSALEQFLDPQHLRQSGYARLKRADVVGDSTPERLVELKAGPGRERGGVEIQTEHGAVVMRAITKAWLTDFGVVRASSPEKFDLVVYEYPTAMSPKRQGSFSVVTVPDKKLVATWDEVPPPSGFTRGPWNGQEALFYFQGDRLTVRSPLGQFLTALDLRYARAFGDIFVSAVGGGYTAVVGSGDGYTPYYTVCLYDAAGALVFQEIESGYSHRLEVSEQSFDVWDRHQKWRYTMNVKH